MKSRKLLLFAVAAVFAVATLPVAAQHHPWGTYAYTGSGSCLDSPSGFTGLAPVTPATAYAQSDSLNGIYTFNGDGTGTWTTEGGATVLDFYPSPYEGAAGLTYSVPFNYTVAKDRTLTLVFGTVTGTIVGDTGVTWTIASFSSLAGRIAQNGTVVLTNAAPTVETLTFYYEGIVFAAVPRICSRTGVLVPLK